MQLGVRHLPLELREAALDLVDEVFDHTPSLTRGGVRTKTRNEGTDVFEDPAFMPTELQELLS